MGGQVNTRPGSGNLGMFDQEDQWLIKKFMCGLFGNLEQYDNTLEHDSVKSEKEKG